MEEEVKNDNFGARNDAIRAAEPLHANLPIPQEIPAPNPNRLPQEPPVPNPNIANIGTFHNQAVNFREERKDDDGFRHMMVQLFQDFRTEFGATVLELRQNLAQTTNTVNGLAIDVREANNQQTGTRRRVNTGNANGRRNNNQGNQGTGARTGQRHGASQGRRRRQGG